MTAEDDEGTSAVVTPGATTSYTLTARNAAGRVAATATVFVGAASVTPTLVSLQVSPPGVTLAPLPWQEPNHEAPQPLKPAELDPRETLLPGQHSLHDRLEPGPALAELGLDLLGVADVPFGEFIELCHVPALDGINDTYTLALTTYALEMAKSLLKKAGLDSLKFDLSVAETAWTGATDAARLRSLWSALRLS